MDRSAVHLKSSREGSERTKRGRLNASIARLAATGLWLTKVDYRRLLVEAGLFNNAMAENTLNVLKEAVMRYGTYVGSDIKWKFMLAI